ncbi:hypothetical protein P175DRAFT_0501676 [Aspergillus ochraceoroseus IBT 24754]|uniref:Uncharacterized protein n=2 Tax=Aspergillus ochraceoroseus TaxID=138278 RepID=A0A2T5LXN6_9EURO|nr:uncharacterized protein P175DRAFT_0501676 [Aspergillus ochraceoroseus IBT 24754]KKK14508.1 hypothetical protein AOCH_001603 [Aspergillus ochraceoroseus]PTU21048.1 hypothetical protein P175DRAFT_0501676 [Aspergillus ochraceoroseus IBT 24754]
MSSQQRTRTFLRLFRVPLSSSPSSCLKSSPRRHFTTPPPPSSTAKNPQSRLRQLNDRLPSFLRAYTTPLLGAPATHITSFLLLHEITAIVPLFGLVAAFHYGNWLPDLTAKSAFKDGTERVGRWLRKKGWVDEVEAGEVVTGTNTDTDTEKTKGVRLVLEFATAYAVTKALLPLRIATSVWATPWFARVILAPIGRGARRLLKKSNN